MSKQAILALKAANLRRTCGRYAASKFAKKHQITELYRIACQLLAAEAVK